MEKGQTVLLVQIARGQETMEVILQYINVSNQQVIQLKLTKYYTLPQLKKKKEIMEVEMVGEPIDNVKSGSSFKF